MKTAKVVLAHERRRIGDRRLYVLLRRGGHAVNRKRVYRLYSNTAVRLRRWLVSCGDAAAGV